MSVLVKSPPSAGKTFGVYRIAAESDNRITHLIDRGNDEGYDMCKEFAKEVGLREGEYRILPSFFRDCPTPNGANGEWWTQKCEQLYNELGLTGSDIHVYGEKEPFQQQYLDGQSLPCGTNCPYKSAYDFNPDDYKVLIGHYSHSTLPKATSGRQVIFDEYPGSTFLLTPADWDPAPKNSDFDRGITAQRNAITEYLEYRSLGFGCIDDLKYSSDVPDELYQFLGESGDKEFAIQTGFYRHTPDLVYALLAQNDRGHSKLPDNRGVCAYDKKSEGIWTLTPPALINAKSVIGLDGTPTRRMWEVALGERFRLEEVLTKAESQEYLQHVLQNHFVELRTGAKPYHSIANINEQIDHANIEDIATAVDEDVYIITSTKAKAVYNSSDKVDIPELAVLPENIHFGGLKSSNELGDAQIAFVIGSPGVRDRQIRSWCILADNGYQKPDRSGQYSGGMNLSYGDFGDKVLHHYREHEVLQAALRPGRTTDPSYIYVLTDALPKWVPRADSVRRLNSTTDGEIDVRDALTYDWQTTKEIAESAGRSRGYVSRKLSELIDLGWIETQPQGRSRVYRWG